MSVEGRNSRPIEKERKKIQGKEKQIRIKDGKELENAKERQETANIADNMESKKLEKMK